MEVLETLSACLLLRWRAAGPVLVTKQTSCDFLTVAFLRHSVAINS